MAGKAALYRLTDEFRFEDMSKALDRTITPEEIAQLRAAVDRRKASEQDQRVTTKRKTG